MIHAAAQPPSVPACPSAAPGAAARLPAAPGLPRPPSLTGSRARGCRGGISARAAPLRSRSRPGTAAASAGRTGGCLAHRPRAASLGYTADTQKAGVKAALETQKVQWERASLLQYCRFRPPNLIQAYQDRSPWTYWMKTVLLTSRGFKSFSTKYLMEKIVARGRKRYKRY